MVTTVKCPSCGSALKLREGIVKTLKEFRCLRCGAPIPVADASPAPSEAAASTRHIPLRPLLPGTGTASAQGSTPAASGMISVTCSGCGRAMNLRTELAGKKVRCKQCQAVTLVPESAGEPGAATSKPPPPAPPSPPPPAAPPLPQPPEIPAGGGEVQAAEVSTPPAPPPMGGATSSQVASPELDSLRHRAEKAELALRMLATQHAEEKADLLHQIETLKRELSEARAAADDLRRDAIARAVDTWAAERQRRADEEVADLRRRLGLT